MSSGIALGCLFDEAFLQLYIDNYRPAQSCGLYYIGIGARSVASPRNWRRSDDPELFTEQ